MSKVRFWQEAALAALQARLIAKPDGSPTDACCFAFDVAEIMYKQHGPALSEVWTKKDSR